MPWRPLALVVLTLGSALAVAHALGAASAPPLLVGVALALLAATALLALDDPARAILAPLPTTLSRRRAQRLSLVGPAAIGAGAILLVAAGAADLLAETTATGVGSLAALASVGLLVGRLAERWREDLLAPVGAGAAVSWVLASAVLPGPGAGAWVAHGWADRPWAWVLAAVVATPAVHRGDPR